ncbi:MAG: ABC transporter permease [Candidatus Micrarchaeota archaeon]|nr:ABC transporter permease [Candidatus Micrarchaeota archaeon]
MDTNAIYVMWLRDMKRFLRAKSRIIGMLMMPLFFLLGLGLGLGGLIHLSTGGTYFNFIVPGIVGMSLLFTSIFTGSAVLWDRQFGFLKEILVTPNSRASIVIGRIAGGGTTVVMQSFIVIAISMLIGFQINPSPIALLAVVFMILIATTFISLGLTLGSMISDFQGFQLVTSFFTMPLFFLSNSLFPASSLPSYVQDILFLNPLTYGVDGLRIALLGTGTFPIWVDLIAMLISSAIMISIAVYAFNRTDVG